MVGLVSYPTIGKEGIGRQVQDAHYLWAAQIQEAATGAKQGLPRGKTRIFRSGLDHGNLEAQGLTGWTKVALIPGTGKRASTSIGWGSCYRMAR
ncbi:hypothetical protein GCM10011383_09330 [Hymenobacter cavernae]|uniref:Uncharacterized protein n=1 Tax=Hymenobacter cavernae TaxID=2044852 RepID=A0ABQ1TPR5_9BACT|nr:hypothetical protein GCM10011383_09330 [Hymenobacter cavernae]